MPNSMCVIILAAGVGKRMKTYGPKCTIEIGSNETVISRQIRLMKKSLPNYEILVVVGFQKAKVLKIIDVDFIENKKYEFTNTCVSVNIAIKNKKYWGCNYSDLGHFCLAKRLSIYRYCVFLFS